MEFRRVLFRSEAYRNFPVAERLTALVDYYRSGVRQLAALTRPDVTAGELEAYVDIMMACFFGLGHRTLIGTARDVEQISHETACLLMRALGAPAQQKDRKRVAWGKSVSVCVDLGGRRILKKKKHNIKRHNHITTNH